MKRPPIAVVRCGEKIFANALLKAGALYPLRPIVDHYIAIQVPLSDGMAIVGWPVDPGAF